MKITFTNDRFFIYKPLFSIFSCLLEVSVILFDGIKYNNILSLVKRFFCKSFNLHFFVSIKSYSAAETRNIDSLDNFVRKTFTNQDKVTFNHPLNTLASLSVVLRESILQAVDSLLCAFNVFHHINTTLIHKLGCFNLTSHRIAFLGNKLGANSAILDSLECIEILLEDRNLLEEESCVTIHFLNSLVQDGLSNNCFTIEL